MLLLLKKVDPRLISGRVEVDTILGILLLNLALLVMQHRAYINPRYAHILAHLLQTGVELLDLILLILDVGISQDIVVGGDRALMKISHSGAFSCIILTIATKLAKTSSTG